MSYAVEPWQLRWQGLSVDDLHQTESTFALANGHIGLRGTLDEGEPRGLPGTYLNGFYEEHQLPYGEGGYGYPEAGQTVVNVTDGKIIRLLVEDEPLDMRYGNAIEHERTLDFRSGTLRRRTVWESPTGRRVTVRSERLVSFTQRAVVAIRYEVEPMDDLQLVVQSDLLANEPTVSRSNDPRVAAALDSPLVNDFKMAEKTRAVLCHHTKVSGLRMAAAMDHEVDVDGVDVRTEIRAEDDLARFTTAVDVAGGRVPEADQVPGLRLVGAAFDARAEGAGRGGSGRCVPDRLGRARRGAEGVPGRLLGGRRHRDRRRRPAAAGDQIRAVPHPAGRGAR